MALQPQPKRILVINSINEATNRLNKAVMKLTEEAKDEAKLTTTYKNGLDVSAKTDLKEAYQIIFWLGITHFGFPLPTELSDADIDVINPEIRQFDDEL